MLEGDTTEVLSAQATGDGRLIGGRYRLETLIGVGGTADVWRGWDQRRARPVTLKILRERDDPDVRHRFLAEARLLESVTHPAIVPVVGIGDALGVTFIALEHVEARSLAEVAAHRGPFAIQEVASIVLRLADGLEAVHRHGYVHLDVKPANILLCADGSVRLIDLGIAQPTGQLPHEVRGTRRYVAPEILRGCPPTPASDVYGLALVARELLGGRPETPRVARTLRRALDPVPGRRHARARSFAIEFALAIQVDEALTRLWPLARAVRSRIRGLRGMTMRRAESVARYLRAAQRSPSRAIVSATIATTVVAALLLPLFGRASADEPSFMPPTPVPLAPAAFALPPLASYAAGFETQAPYPRVSPGGPVEWVVALRNTGSSGWYRGIAGAQASLALDDGTVAAAQTTDYVGPGQVGWFVVRFRAPKEPGEHVVALHPRIEGLGQLPDLGIYAVVMVASRRATSLMWR